jgi:hypothetical protein
LSSQEKSGCLATLLQLLGLVPKPDSEPKPEPEPSFPYHLRDDFLSPAEISFYHILRTVVGEGAAICPKVSLGDLFYAKTGDYGENRSWMNRIDRKHVDFIVCDPQTMRPILGVELDNASHQRAERRKRDRLVDRVFSAAGLPLARVPAQAQYNTSELKAYLRQTMTRDKRPSSLSSEDQPVQASSQTTSAAPPCPNCGTPMVLRQVKRDGPRKGEAFWGCPHFPKCRGTRDLEEAPASTAE